MAVLPDADRMEVWAQMMRETSRSGEPLAVLKADLRAAVNALDGFLNTNAAAINSAIPLPARTALTTPQKARLLMFVIEQRYVKGA